MSNPVFEYWSREKKIQLIREYKARPVIWDKNDVYYHFKGTQRAQAWREIATIMNSTPAICMVKIKSLKTNFKQIQEKMLKRGKDITHSGEWVVYKEMMFLLEYITVKKKGAKLGEETTVSTVVNEAKNKTTKIEIEPEKILSMTPKLFLEIKKGVVKPVAKTMILHEMHAVKNKEQSSIAVPKPKTTIPNQIFMPKLVPIVKKRRIEENQPTAGPSGNTLESEVITAFVEFVARKMKNYSESNKKTVQHEIIQTLFRADERDRWEKSNDNSTEQNEDLIIPDLPIKDNNISDESDSEPASPSFKTESITEMINENDDLFETYENKEDLLKEIERQEQLDHDNEQFDVQYLDEHAFTNANESEVKIKHEMSESNDEDYII